MSTEHTAEATYLTPDQLRVGIYVVIELPWFAHPFSLNQFKIKSNEQLRELRALKLKQYRYDPQRSDPPPADWAPAPSQQTDTSADTTQDTSATPEPMTDFSPEMESKRQRVEKLHQHREKLSQAERAFVKASNVMRNLNRNLFSRPKETLEEMTLLVHHMVETFLEGPEATLQVMSEKAGGEEVYYHSLNVTILAMMLAKELGFTPASARDLGVAAMLHDIGKIEIPDRVLKKSHAEYNKAEWSLYRMHVDYGVDIGRKLNLAPAILQMIAQHHEYCDGTGYPKGLKEAAISPGARLICLVNYYDDLCNPSDIHKAMTPHAALSFMFAQRSAKFDKRALQVMVRSLGVYPPGSIVMLSNEAIGTVMSVNPKKPLRPWVMIYDAQVPKEEALMLDLEAESEISITKSLTPALLPPQVAAYLYPRKRVTYFFSGDEASGSPGRQV